MATPKHREVHVIRVLDEPTFTKGVVEFYQRATQGIPAHMLVAGRPLPKIPLLPDLTFFHIKEQDVWVPGDRDASFKAAIYCTVCWQAHISPADGLRRPACRCHTYVAFMTGNDVADAAAVLGALRRSLSRYNNSMVLQDLWRLVTKHVQILFMHVNYITYSGMKSLSHAGLLCEEVLADVTWRKLGAPESNPLILAYNTRLPTLNAHVCSRTFIIGPLDATMFERMVEDWYLWTQQHPVGTRGVERAYNLTALWFKEQGSILGVFCTRCRGKPADFVAHRCKGGFVNLSFYVGPIMPMDARETLLTVKSLASDSVAVRALRAVLTKHVFDLLNYQILPTATVARLDQEGLLDLSVLSPVHLNHLRSTYTDVGDST